MADETGSPWRIHAIVLGLFAACCGLPAIALLVVIFGGATAVLTGAIGVGIGAASVAGILLAYYAARRRASAHIDRRTAQAARRVL